MAVIPLAIFVCGFVASLSMKFLNMKFGRVGTFCLGAVLGAAACLWIKVGCKMGTASALYEIYGVAALVGFGSSTMLVTSLSVTADLIGDNRESGAFVYGAMSLSDKVSNGVAVILVQMFIPTNMDTCIRCRMYFRDILFYVCGGAALAGLACVLSLASATVGRRRRDAYEALDGVAAGSAEAVAVRRPGGGSGGGGGRQPDEGTPLL